MEYECIGNELDDKDMAVYARKDGVSGLWLKLGQEEEGHKDTVAVFLMEEEVSGLAKFLKRNFDLEKLLNE